MAISGIAYVLYRTTNGFPWKTDQRNGLTSEICAALFRKQKARENFSILRQKLAVVTMLGTARAITQCIHPPFRRLSLDLTSLPSWLSLELAQL